VEASDRGLISDTAPAFASLEASDRTAGVSAEIRTYFISNRVQKRYLLRKLAGQKYKKLQLYYLLFRGSAQGLKCSGNPTCRESYVNLILP
jgi:hypothetical protein